MTTLSLTERLNTYGERVRSEQGDTLFLPQAALQHFPELGDGTSMEAYANLARQAKSRIVPYEIVGGGVSTDFCYLPTGKARIYPFGNLVKELELDFIQRLELENNLTQKATIQ
ncbi:MAG: hypothetical protein HYS62_00045 [Candidatus Aenigmarchaeota archaeon]|nr:hypothetical protein [Candidatus Aenigmarchaeota archaeon]